MQAIDVILLLTVTCSTQTYAQPSESPSKTIPPRSGASAVAEDRNATGGLVGDEACRECHQDKVVAYYRTAHHLTSQTADKNSVVGTFNEGANVLRTSNPNLYFRMDANEKGFFQTAVWGTPPTTWSRTERLDLVIGSGGKGQSYLFWNEDELFQLPVGYSTVLNQWINGPGYRDGTANFERPIIPRCLECHATFFKSFEPLPSSNRYDKTNFVLGISCERCHGPGRGHVAQYDSKTALISGPAIVNPAKLSQDRQFEVCSQCHGGQGVRELAPAFSYIPGQPLENYVDLGPIDSGDIDVHGKQVVLLKKSRCFQASANMSCATCHDVHQPERDLAAFSERCLRCHRIEACGVFTRLGHEIASNCIDCHMPNQESRVVFLDVNGKKLNPRFRSHWIKVYSDSAPTKPQ